MKKLTLSMDEKDIRHAKRIAAHNRTSVSAMFARMIRGMERAKETPPIPPGSLTAQACGFITLPKGKTPRDVLTEALMEKYGIKQ